MTDTQIKKVADIKQMVTNKGLKNNFIAKRLSMCQFRLSRILSGKEDHVSDSVIDKLNSYITAVNSDSV